MFLTLVLLSIYISCVDWKYHRITNKSLLIALAVFSCWSLATRSDLRFSQTFLIALLALIGYKFGLGAGDVKLIALLSLFFFPRTPERLIDLVEGFVATSMALIILDRFRGRSFVDSIALAPAICAAFIWCAI